MKKPSAKMQQGVKNAASELASTNVDVVSVLKSRFSHIVRSTEPTSTLLMPPWRSAFCLLSSSSDTEGLTHYSHLHGLLPRLGAFVEQPEDVPFDYDDILAMIAPRPTLVIAPTLDRYHKVDSVRSLVERARTAFRMQGDEAGLELEIPEGFANFERSPARTSRVIQWLNTQAATHL